MFFRKKRKYILLVITTFLLCGKSQILTKEEESEIILKLRPLKYNPSNGCNEFCKSIICKKITDCRVGTVAKNESFCGCCDACVKYLDIGQPCKNIITGSLALGVQSRCKPGTICKNRKCELEKNITGCLQQREHRLSLKGKGNYAKNIWIPQCNEAGNFIGKQKKIRRSICVDEWGSRIFGSADNITDKSCACSRHMLKKKESEGVSYNVGLQEHCSPSGNFDTLQCIRNLCYCADKETGEVKSPLVQFDFLDKLPCYDRKKHRTDYLKNCEVELQRTRKLSYEFWLKGTTLLGIGRIKCDPDGSFSPTQCQTDTCVCTDKEGVGIGSYHKEKKVMKINMTCNCARGETSKLLTSPYNCLDYGNYNSFTCFDDKCICVDEDGDGISIELKKSDVEICKELIKNLKSPPGDEIKQPDGNDDDGDEDNSYYD